MWIFFFLFFIRDLSRFSGFVVGLVSDIFFITLTCVFPFLFFPRESVHKHMPLMPKTPNVGLYAGGWRGEGGA